ncbi:GNAT family N-acetyltransferase [Acuticoccus mangrovi]|uniref:GNAT family N-acetyltransferase n=1 Tax=Acuticoccus mangrovi TaxID=2796142 RepID=A0A934ISZ2_9HYPH|nr:GNAT family N-acetyltransferase [Acuticoccus mangrovi]MBJ3777637.1 GNAT family N-acetyltransferase [Acuticoccus mangrovi]
MSEAIPSERATPDIPPECIVKQGDDWMLVSPVPEHLAAEAAAYSVAQRATLNRIVGLPEVREKVLGNRLRPDRICVALVKGEIAGLISYRMDGEGSVWPDPSRYRDYFGSIGGTARYWLTEATLRRGRPDELYLEGFKVDPKARGRGIGTSLLHWLGSEVIRRGKRAWRTEASITADAAMRVYQSVGAKPVKTVSLGPLGHVFDRHKFVVLVWEAPTEAAERAA